MTAVKLAAWCAVLLCCRALLHDHRSVDRPYKRLTLRSNTTISRENQQPSVTLSNTLLPSQTKQSIPPSIVSLSVASPTIATIRSTSVAEGTIPSTSTDGGQGVLSASDVRSDEAKSPADTFIASITTLARPPLTTPSSVLASHTNSTTLTPPPISISSTGNTTTGRYSNYSTIIPLTSTTTSISTITTQDFCTPSPTGPFTTVIEYSVVHTWTITWWGNPHDYTPPFPTISTPTQCTPTTSPTGRFTVSVCDSSGQSCSLVHTTGDPATATEPWWMTDTSAVRGMEPTLTFVTTDKNPAVVFPTSSPPDYGGDPSDPMDNRHSAPLPDQMQSSDPPGYGNDATTDIKSAPITTPVTTPVTNSPSVTVPASAPVTITVKPSIVVIDGQTFTDNPGRPTSTVVVNRETFTINPTQVVGVGATVTRPPMSISITTPPSTKTTIGGIGVDIEGSSVVIDQTTFTIGANPTTVIIKGQTVTLGPGAIVFPSQTIAIPTVQDTTQVVFGAELVTAIGSDKVVIEGSTITYGPGSSTITEVIDGDTILIGPSGIIANGYTYGGSSVAASTEMQFAAVGGVTITQVGPTLVVIQGVTYTLDPIVSGQASGQTSGQTSGRASGQVFGQAPRQIETTTVVGGETITIGPEGVAIETWTLDSPYASTTTITPGKGATVALPMSTATATAIASAANTNKKSSGSSLASRRPPWLLTASTATIVGILEAGVLALFWI
ncbi:hypothetical protein F4678DRAFT_452080 [Xylaria arbuscula]|nr:hypothetical protein F4678DRAFT_452080 [Xylaria arbuscula]